MNTDLFSLSSLANIWLMLTMTMILLPSILILLIIMIPIMALADDDLTVSATVNTVKVLHDVPTTSILPPVPRNFPSKAPN